jgi:hypothetical protein
MAEKRTQKEMYERLISVVSTSNAEDVRELIEFCEGRIEQLAKKTSSGRKANPLTEKVENFIRETLEEYPNELFTCSQLGAKATKALDLDTAVTPQRVSPIMKALVAEGFAVAADKSNYKKA